MSIVIPRHTTLESAREKLGMPYAEGGCVRFATFSYGLCLSYQVEVVDVFGTTQNVRQKTGKMRRSVTPTTHIYIIGIMCTASAYQAIDREDLIKSPKSLIRGKKVERIRLAEVRD